VKDPVLRDWGVYLGMIALDPLVRAAPRQLLIDPTAAVRSVVADFLNAEMTASGFLEGLSERLCVIDGGIARRRVVEQIDASALPWEADESMVSPTLSLALYRLERSGHLTMTSKADAPASERRQLTMGAGKPNRIVDRVAPGNRREAEVR